jgi:sugar O-acyltransferase (sialic acid O-acetyltransferase NeuD family)
VGKRLVIIGAGGHGSVAADCAMAMGCFGDIVFLDSFYPNNRKRGCWTIIGKPEDAAQVSYGDSCYFVAIGNNKAREEIVKQILQQNLPLVTLQHPTAVVSQYSEVAQGVLICANAVINPLAVVGQAAIINTSANVEHDCVIGEYAHISVGACLAGNVSVGSGSFVGINSTVIESLTIGCYSTLGAGSTLLQNLPSYSVAVGSPAKVIKQIEH